MKAFSRLGTTISVLADTTDAVVSTAGVVLPNVVTKSGNVLDKGLSAVEDIAATANNYTTVAYLASEVDRNKALATNEITNVMLSFETTNAATLVEQAKAKLASGTITDAEKASLFAALKQAKDNIEAI